MAYGLRSGEVMPASSACRKVMAEVVEVVELELEVVVEVQVE